MSEDVPEDTNNKRKWRKKRRNFLSNAKKYMRKNGKFGRGTQMPDEFYQYFVGILEAIKQGIQDKDERQTLVDNVLDRTKGEELIVVGNQLGSRVIQLLLPYASAKHLEHYMEVLTPDLRRLCSDNYSSHILETLLKVAAERATEHLQNDIGEKDNECDSDNVPEKKIKLETKETVKYKKKHIKKCHEYAVKMSKYALNNLEDFVTDQYANHIVRTSIKSLSGISLLPGEKPQQNMFRETFQSVGALPPQVKSIEYRTVPEEFKEIIKEYAERLSSWPQFVNLAYDYKTSALLQVLLFALKPVDKHLTRDLIKKLMNESFAPDDWDESSNDDKKEQKVDVHDSETKTQIRKLPPVFDSEPAVRLLEAALFIAKKKTYTQIYAKCFINRLGQLALLPILNYTVQRLIDNCDVKEEFESMYDELSDKFGALLASSNTGVLTALGKACLRLQARQTQFVNHLEAALQCSGEEQQKWLAVCCLRLLPLDRVELDKLETEYFINIHGSVILQTILDFQRPTKAVNSLLELTPTALCVVLCHKRGAYIADALCSGRYVGVKARDKLMRKLKGCYQKLALSQYGSRALESIFDVASLEQKLKIMTELGEKSNLLNSTQYGKIIASKLDVAGFKTSQKQWEKTWSKKTESC